MNNWSLLKYHPSVPFGERGLPCPEQLASPLASPTAVSVGAEVWVFQIVFTLKRHLWLWFESKMNWACSLNYACISELLSMTWKGSCHIFPFATACHWIRWTTRAHTRQGECRAAGKTRDCIFTVCLISLSVTRNFILYLSHPAAEALPHCSKGTLVQGLKGLLFSRILLLTTVLHTAVRLVGRKQLFWRAQCIASVTV